MSKKLYEESNIQDIASAIREKNGTENQYTVAQMASAVRDITTQPTLQEKTIVSNGSYTPDEGFDGFSEVTVNVPSEGGSAVIQRGELTPASELGVNGDIYLQYIGNCLRSDGDCSIDTGVSVSDVYGFKFTFGPISVATSYQTYLGAVRDNFTIGSYDGVSGIYIRRRGYEDVRCNILSPCTIEYSNGDVIIDGERKMAYDSTVPVGDQSANIFIFSGANGDRKSAMKFYSLILYGATGNVIFDGIAQSNNGVACVYDSISESYILPSGSATLEDSGMIEKAFAKVDENWQDLIGTNIADITSGGSAVIQPLSVTQNGVYNPPSGVDGFGPVSVNVGGGSSNVLFGDDAPTASIGSNGDYYARTGPAEKWIRIDITKVARDTNYDFYYYGSKAISFVCKDNEQNEIEISPYIVEQKYWTGSNLDPSSGSNTTVFRSAIGNYVESYGLPAHYAALYRIPNYFTLHKIKLTRRDGWLDYWATFDVYQCDSSGNSLSLLLSEQDLTESDWNDWDSFTEFTPTGQLVRVPSLYELYHKENGIWVAV